MIFHEWLFLVMGKVNLMIFIKDAVPSENQQQITSQDIEIFNTDVFHHTICDFDKTNSISNTQKYFERTHTNLSFL